jgi:hypothetical protein
LNIAQDRVSPVGVFAIGAVALRVKFKLGFYFCCEYGEAIAIFRRDA